MNGLSQINYIRAAQSILSPYYLDHLDVTQPVVTVEALKEKIDINNLTQKNQTFYHTHCQFFQFVAAIFAKLGICYFAAPIGVVYWTVKSLAAQPWIQICQKQARPQEDDKLQSYKKSLKADLRLTLFTYAPIVLFKLFIHLNRLPESHFLLKKTIQITLLPYAILLGCLNFIQLLLPINHLKSCTHVFEPSFSQDNAEDSAKTAKLILDLFLHSGIKNIEHVISNISSSEREMIQKKINLIIDEQSFSKNNTLLTQSFYYLDRVYTLLSLDMQETTNGEKLMKILTPLFYETMKILHERFITHLNRDLFIELERNLELLFPNLLSLFEVDSSSSETSSLSSDDVSAYRKLNKSATKHTRNRFNKRVTKQLRHPRLSSKILRNFKSKKNKTNHFAV